MMKARLNKRELKIKELIDHRDCKEFLERKWKARYSFFSYPREKAERNVNIFFQRLIEENSYKRIADINRISVNSVLRIIEWNYQKIMEKGK